MCCYWQDPTVEILVDSDELDAIEIEFGIEFDDDSAMELYDSTLGEASAIIMDMVTIQNKGKHNSYIRKIS